MIDIKYFLLISAVAVAGCSAGSSRGDDSDTGTYTDCPNGKYSGEYEILEQSDVAALKGYTSIGGDLAIMCPSCTDLSDLICLTSVCSFTIAGNGTLTNLDGLSSITFVELGLQIQSNDALTNLDGLSGITSLGGCLHIESNNALTNLDGLGALTSEVVSLLISENDALTNLDGLSGITLEVVSLYISDNDALTDLDGLSGITSVYGDVSIKYNDELPDCEACDLLDQFTSAPTSIDVHDNLDDTCTPVPTNCP